MSRKGGARRPTGREVYKASITAGELLIVYYGIITTGNIHPAEVAYRRLTSSQGREPYAYLDYNQQGCNTLQKLFAGPCQVQQRPAKRGASTLRLGEVRPSLTAIAA